MCLQWIESLITSYYYNRELNDIIQMLEFTKARINDYDYFNCGYDNDDVNILFGAICIRYGDYGTSPRSGWIDEEYKPNLLKLLDDQILYYKQLPEER